MTVAPSSITLVSDMSPPRTKSPAPSPMFWSPGNVWIARKGSAAAPGVRTTSRSPRTTPGRLPNRYVPASTRIGSSATGASSMTVGTGSASGSCMACLVSRYPKRCTTSVTGPLATDSKLKMPAESVSAPSSVSSRNTFAPPTAFPAGSRTLPSTRDASCPARLAGTRAKTQIQTVGMAAPVAFTVSARLAMVRVHRQRMQ